MRYDTDHSTILNVPYSRKAQAKALGARWDPLSKHWYAPAGRCDHMALRKAGFLPAAQTAERGKERKAVGPATSRAGHPVEHRAETIKQTP